MCSYFGLYPELTSLVSYSTAYTTRRQFKFPFPYAKLSRLGGYDLPPDFLHSDLLCIPATASLRSSTLGLNGYSRMRSATVKFRSFVFFGPLAWSYMYLPQSMRLELSSTVHAPGITIPLTSPATEKP